MPRHEKHPPFIWESILGIFTVKTGDFLRFLTQAYPLGGVRALYIYIYIERERFFSKEFWGWGFGGHSRISAVCKLGLVKTGEFASSTCKKQ